jgi:hypothetical protein
MLALLDARQLQEMYAFARLEPLDEPLEVMLAQIAHAVARTAGADVDLKDFKVKRTTLSEEDPADEVEAQMFLSRVARAAALNEKL